MGHGFTPRQSLQSWVDVIASGIKPGEVKVLGINGGAIAAAEYRIALALGATVGVVQGSGRAVDEILSDAGWVEAKNLLALPDDPQTLRAFVGSGSPKLPAKTRERLAQKIHRKYCDKRAKEQIVNDPSQEKWPKLKKTFKESNRLQADHIEAKLRQIGCKAVPMDDAPPEFEFKPEEIELLAEMEHGR